MSRFFCQYNVIPEIKYFIMYQYVSIFLIRKDISMQNSRNKTTSTNVSNSKATPSKTTNSDDVAHSFTTDVSDKSQNCCSNSFSPDDSERRDGPGGE